VSPLFQKIQETSRAISKDYSYFVEDSSWFSLLRHWKHSQIGPDGPEPRISSLAKRIRPSMAGVGGVCRSFPTYYISLTIAPCRNRISFSYWMLILDIFSKSQLGSQMDVSVGAGLTPGVSSQGRVSFRQYWNKRRFWTYKKHEKRDS
jgi:hypothetical protein